jgi:hypothetical protein
MSARTVLTATATAAALAAVVPAGVAGADGSRSPHPTPRLEGRAVLPVNTYAPGPPAGSALVPAGQQTAVVNGVLFPTPSQPVEGISAIVEGRGPGEYLAMADNGFGNKLNSRDFNIRAYYIRPEFKTARGGSGAVHLDEPPEFIEFTDPDHLIGFPIVNEDDRVLTGGDIDPESLQRGRNGDLWVGDEFGPWILHFDAEGRLLDPPFALPEGVVSPDNPIPTGPVTQPSSRGIEGMAITPNGRWLYVVLEGATAGDPADLRRVYEFDTRAKAFTLPRLPSYRVSLTNNLIADVQALGRWKLALIERDNAIGANALYRRVFRVDLRDVTDNGSLAKTEVVNLARIPDPDLVSLPSIHQGDVGLGDPYQVTCQSVEALHVLSHSRLLVGCDNNFPNSGRNPALADDSEFITIRI